MPKIIIEALESRIRVLHIIKSLGRGGAEMLLPETLRLHDRGKFEFHYLFFLPWKDQMVESLRQNGGIVCCFQAGDNVRLMLRLWKVAKYVRKNEIQLIHAHLPWAGILSRIVGKITRIPVIYTEHNKQERYHVGTRIANLMTMHHLKMIIAVSGDVADSIRRYRPRLKIPVRTVLNGVNVERFSPGLFSGHFVRERLGIPADAPVIGTIAVFRFQKRLDLWMELAEKILQQIPNVHFIMVGDGPLKDELLMKRNSLDLKDRIHLPGLETEVRNYLATFDIYMMTSVFEGLPVALLEAMAMQCAIVSTDAGGIKEVVRHGIDGLLCPVEQPEKLVNDACALLKDRDRRIRYGENGRKRVVEHFSMKKMVGELEELYEEILLQ